MKLYYTPGACSLSPHIALRESGLPFTIEAVDLRAKVTKSGADFRAINPKGYVPALELDDGQVLTEGPAIVQYVADRAPDKKLAPANGTVERARLQEWLPFIGTEIHKTLGGLFNPTLTDDQKQAIKDRAAGRLDYAAAKLAGPFLFGEPFTVADGYLYVMVRWAKMFGMDLARWPALVAFREQVEARPGVRAALEAEGLPADGPQKG